MAKGHVAARAFDVGPTDPPRHYEPGDSFPSDYAGLDDLVKNGYVTAAGGNVSTDENVNPVTGLPPKEHAAYEENEGSVAVSPGVEEDVVGEGTDQSPQGQKARAKRTSSTPGEKKSTSGRKSTAKRGGSRARS